MRTESCRNCGNKLVVIELCRVCKQPLHYHCGNCRKFVDDPVHLHHHILVY